MSQPAETTVTPAQPATPFELLSGEGEIARLVEAFYDAMEREPAFARLRAIHAADLTPMRARLADYLTQWTGGPRRYAERHPERGCIVSAHARFPIDRRMAEDWMACMRRAFAVTGASEDFRRIVEPVMARMCEGLRNAG